MHTFCTPKSAVTLNYDCMPILGLKSRDSTAFVSSSVRIIYKLKNFNKKMRKQMNKKRKESGLQRAAFTLTKLTFAFARW